MHLALREGGVLYFVGTQAEKEVGRVGAGVAGVESVVGGVESSVEKRPGGGECVGEGKTNGGTMA